MTADRPAPAELAASREHYDANACGDCGGLRGRCRCPDGLVRGGERLPVIVLPIRTAK